MQQDKIFQEMQGLLESRLDVIREVLELDLTLFDKDLKPGEEELSVTEYLIRLVWHDDDHAQQIARLKGQLGRRGLMGDPVAYPQWFLRQALLSRARLLMELVDLLDEDLDARAGPDDWSVQELLDHIVRTEQEFLLPGIQAAIENRSPDDRASQWTRGGWEKSH